MNDGVAPDPADDALPPVQQAALDGIATMRGLLDLAEVVLRDPELGAHLAATGREAWEALVPPERRATVLAAIATVVAALRDGEGTST